MAKNPQNTNEVISSILFFCFFFSILTAESDKISDSFSRKLSQKKLGFKQEKLSHLHFYFHDIHSGKNPTAIQVAGQPLANSTPPYFGAVTVIDNALTVGPERTSKQVGRAQGLYTSASQSEPGLLMVLNYVFTEGKYNGSTLSILGRNSLSLALREMPIVGGSQLFRFARGYALARTHPSSNITTGDAVVEYNVYVLHY